VSKIKNDKAATLEEDRGYLLLEVNTDVQLKKVELRGAENVNLTQADLKAGSNYILIELEAGEYYVNKVSFDTGYYNMYLKTNEDFFYFNVKPQTISYIGTLSVKFGNLFGIGSTLLVNNSSYALEFMQESFPNILNSRKIVYSGPGKDLFLENNHTPTHTPMPTVVKEEQ